MKKNLTKLALSGAALAAVAATLGTSTYAWYTTNPTVSANNIVAGTSDTGSSSIFISKDKAGVAKKSWSSKVTLTSADFMVASPSLIPTSYVSAGQFAGTTVDGTSKKTILDVANKAAAGTNVAYVQLHFKSSKTTNAQSIYIKSITVENTTSLNATNKTYTLPTADNLLYTGTDSTVAGMATNKSTYAVDFRDALAMAVYNAGATANTGSYDKAFSIAAYKGTTNTATSLGTEVQLIAGEGNGKAHEYFDAVMDNDLDSTAKVAAGTYDSNAIALCPTDGTNYATVNFYIFLDGASTFCYDACQGQQFAINLEFTSDVTAAIGYTAPVQP